jgi:hypothetical protein
MASQAHAPRHGPASLPLHGGIFMRKENRNGQSHLTSLRYQLPHTSVATCLVLHNSQSSYVIMCPLPHTFESSHRVTRHNFVLPKE